MTDKTEETTEEEPEDEGVTEKVPVPDEDDMDSNFEDKEEEDPLGGTEVRSIIEKTVEAIHSQQTAEIYDTIIEQVIARVKRDIPERRVVERKIQVAPVHVKHPALTGANKVFIFVCLMLLAVVPWVLAKAVYVVPAAPEVTVEAPEVTINGSEIVDSLMTRRLDFDEHTGLYIPLPAEADDPARFRAACRSVCDGEVRWATRFPRGRDQERTPVPEHPVLVNDPTTQTCVCFSGDRVTRFVGWNRR